MARKPAETESRSVELTAKLVLLQLYALGAPQETIARVVGKSGTWVTNNLKGVPKPKKVG